MTALNIQAVQNDTDGACMVQEESCMTKEEILSGIPEGHVAKVVSVRPC